MHAGLMKKPQGSLWGALGALLLGIGGILFVGSAFAGTQVFYTGQGWTSDENPVPTYSLNDERCGKTGEKKADDGNTGQFVNWNGPGQPYEKGNPYLVWVLTANGATSAQLTLPDGTVDMIKVGGTFKYASNYYSYASLVGGVVHAVYEGKAKGNVQLVVSHGCKPFQKDRQKAWCSPGYWRNASDGAWALTGYTKTDLFNATAVPNFYDTASGANPTLIQVLTTPGANTFGSARPPYGLNAFNATGAFLTDQIPGYTFDPSKIGEEDACPIDNHGVFKPKSN